jgi:hypothetical protein
MNLALINPRVWLEIALAAAIAGFCWWGYNAVYDRGAASVQAEWDKDKAAQLEATNAALRDAAAATAALQAKADAQRKAKNAQIDRLNTDLADALASLRDRPARPGADNLPSDTTPGTAPSCTGAQLYKPDAEFLARESARAERVRVDLAECQAAHGAAREALAK